MSLLAAVLGGTFFALLAGALTGSMPRRIAPRVARPQLGAAHLWLQQAGLAVTPAQFWLGSASVGGVALVVLGSLTGSPVVAVVPAAALALLPRAYFARVRAERLRRVQRAWPDGLRDIVASIAAGRSLTQAVSTMARTGPEPLREAFARFPLLARMLGTVPALEVVKEELADPTTDRVVEVLILAHERGGPIVRDILDDLVASITKDLKIQEEIVSEGLEMRINSRAVVAIPWAMLVLLTVTSPAFRAFYGSPAGVVVVAIGGAMTLVGLVILQRLSREQGERRVFGSAAVRVEGALMDLAVLAALLVGVAAALLARRVVPPTPRLAPRVRPYTAVARAQLGRGPDVLGGAEVVGAGGAVPRLFVPPLRAAARRLAALVGSGGDEQLAHRLLQAGWRDRSPDDERVRQIAAAGAGAAAGAALGAVVLRSALLTLVLAALGFVVGLSRARGALDRAIEVRRDRIRLELPTIDHLLAITVRTGAGPIQAVQRIVDRGNGVVAEELADVLRATRNGEREGDAFRRAAERTPEPAAARTYHLFAAGTERGHDLAAALLALSQDIRDARREELRRSATRRRAALLVPTVAILAPIMLLFIAAPLPSIVFGR